MDELIRLFDLGKCSKAGARFDFVKCRWFNHEYIQKADNRLLAEQFLPIVREHGVDESIERVEKVVEMMKNRVDFVKELWGLSSFFFIAPDSYDDKTVKKRWKEDSAKVMCDLATLLENLDDFSLAHQEEVVTKWIEDNNLGMGNVMNAWRLTLVGEGKGPHMFDISSFLGKEETLRRMRRAIDVLK